MFKKTQQGIPFYEFELFKSFGDRLQHAVFTRHTDINDKKLLAKIFNAPPVSFGQQMHGISSITIDKKNASDPKIAETNGDVWITAMKNVPILIRTADCASIIIFDPKKNVIANIHAGWRGLAQKIIHATIDRMREKFDCETADIFAAISPMLGPCCCRFTDPEKELPRHMHKYISEEDFVDLWAAAEGHLRECGVPKSHIENPRICTYCNPEEFFSYRREGETGRFGTAIMLL